MLRSLLSALRAAPPIYRGRTDPRTQYSLRTAYVRFSANSQVLLREPLEAAGRLANMESKTQARMRARDAAMRQLDRITMGVAFAAIAGVGVLTAVSAYSIPGTSSSSLTATTSTSTSSSTSSGLQSSSTGVTSSSGSAVAVSGGSH
jgi:hypothetical protein